LISPPPHHDIYSIEDLAQLIYDLKQINPLARIAVKLVSEAGIGTIAAGVAKAQADVIHISGHDGGTGASPLGSIKNAGSPWEIGLAETQQTLVLNGLRSRVSLRVDGGFKTGRDVVIAAMLGAEEFGFGTAALVALGCVMARQCHMNNCPVGIATQSKRLRERFAGKPEMVEGYFIHVAEQVRDILASLGFRSLGEIIGYSNLLQEKANVKTGRDTKFDLQPMIAQAGSSADSRQFYFDRKSFDPELSLNSRLVRDTGNAIETLEPVRLSYRIKNTDRAVGSSLAGKIARQHGDLGLPDESFDLTFYGSAGQSFGAFAMRGMKITLFGEANDYIAKGMSGGVIAIRPSDRARFNWSENVIAGNTVMYGATGGSLFVAGRAGERFCVRNSGGTAVVEGVGDHGCEYMTAGTVVVLGDTGGNFAAGMTGGTAYVLDIDRRFEAVCNPELVNLEPLSDEEDMITLHALVTKHHQLTDSPRAREVLLRWESYVPRFWKVITQGAQASWESSNSMIANVVRANHVESEAALTTELDPIESSLSGERTATVA
jgi:glutamate synthase domain-containing protein 3